LDIKLQNLWKTLRKLTWNIFYRQPVKQSQNYKVFMVALCNRADHYIFAL